MLSTPFQRNSAVRGQADKDLSLYVNTFSNSNNKEIALTFYVEHFNTLALQYWKHKTKEQSS